MKSHMGMLEIFQARWFSGVSRSSPLNVRDKNSLTCGRLFRAVKGVLAQDTWSALGPLLSPPHVS